MHHHSLRTVLLVAIGTCLALHTPAQYFLEHFPTGMGYTLHSDVNGGVRMMCGTDIGCELRIDASGNIIGSTAFTGEQASSIALTDLDPFGLGQRLAFGSWYDPSQVVSWGTMMLARIADDATTADAVLIGRANIHEYAHEAEVVSDGVVVMGRAAFGTPPAILPYKLVVGKFDADLDAVWLQALDVPGTSMQPKKLFVDPTSGEISCFGISTRSDEPDNVAWLIRLSATGELQWSTIYDHAGPGGFDAVLIRAADGSYYMAQQVSIQDNFQFVLSHISADGVPLASSNISTPGPARLNDMQLYDGAFYLAGTTGYNSGEQHVLLMKMDLEGQVEWAHTYGVADHWNVAGKLLVTTGTDGQDVIWVSGIFRVNGTSPQDMLLMKVDGNGEGLECTFADPVFTAAPTTTTTTSDATVLPYSDLATTTVDIGTYADQVIMTECRPAAVAEHATAVMVRVAPDPTHGPCTVTFASGHGALRVRVLDALGRSVLEQRVATSINTLQLDLSSAKAGAYLLVVDDVRTGGHSALRLVKE
jgi:hypothetical protein